MALKVREIRELLKDKVDPMVLKMLCMMADETGQVDKATNELAKIVDQLVDNMQLLQNAMGNIVGVLNTMPNAVAALQKIKGSEEDQGGDDGHGSH